MLRCERQHGRSRRQCYNRLERLQSASSNRLWACLSALSALEHIKNTLRSPMKQTGKLDYLEMPATGGTLDTRQGLLQRAPSAGPSPTTARPMRPSTKGWTAASRPTPRKRRPSRCRSSIRRSSKRRRGGRSCGRHGQRRSSPFRAAGASISSTRPATNLPSGVNDSARPRLIRVPARRTPPRRRRRSGARSTCSAPNRHPAFRARTKGWYLKSATGPA